MTTPPFNARDHRVSCDCGVAADTGAACAVPEANKVTAMAIANNRQGERVKGNCMDDEWLCFEVSGGGAVFEQLAGDGRRFGVRVLVRHFLVAGCGFGFGSLAVEAAAHFQQCSG